MTRKKHQDGITDYYMKDLGYEDLIGFDDVEKEPTPELMFKHQWWGKYNERHRKEVK